MKSFVLAMFAVVALSSMSFGQDCSNGTCLRPVKEVVQKAVVVIATPVNYVTSAATKAVDMVSTKRPVRRFFQKLRCR